MEWIFSGLSFFGPQNILVTGASRGVGKELVRQLSTDSNNIVIGTVRNPVDFDRSNARTIILDQASSTSVADAASCVKELDVLILNAAMGDDEKLLATSGERFQEYLDVNITGVFRVVKAFLPALRVGKSHRIVLVSSTSGSMALQNGAQAGFTGPYAVTKAACNMLAVQLHNELHKPEGFTVVMIHPGWVATDMGNLAGDGAIPVSESAHGVLAGIQGLKTEDSAKFFSFNGTILPW